MWHSYGGSLVVYMVVIKEPVGTTIGANGTDACAAGVVF